MEDKRFVEEARQMLVFEEGLKTKPYKCPAGKWTIGIGHNLDDKELSLRAIDALFLEDLAEALEGAEKVLGPDFEKFDRVRQLAIVNMVFQLGAAGFANFIKTVRFMKLEQWEDAAQEMLSSKWARQTPERADRVAKMIRFGVWPYRD